MKQRLVACLSLSQMLLLVSASLWLAVEPAQAQNPAGDLLRLINNARLGQGLHPYVVSAQLTAAAQRHCNDMAATGQVSHSGSDGSSDVQRILEAGYGVYEFGPLVGENICSGTGGAEVAFSSWLSLQDTRSNLFHEKYREVGIGAASDAQGRTFWTLTVGAQPNVLPILINEGVASVDTVTVTLRLLPENVVPEGRGTAMGQPVEYRASTGPQFVGAEWHAWATQVAFVLDAAPGLQTVYVQLRDSAGRTTVSQTSVTLTGLAATGTPTEATETEVAATPSASPTAAATSTPTPAASPTSTTTPTALATGTATPTATPTPSATPQPSATVSPSPSATDTPFPSDTPTVVPQLSETATSPPQSAHPPEPTFAAPTTLPTLTEEPILEEKAPTPLADRLAPWAVTLQIVALVLGVYVALRRPGEPVGGETSVPFQEKR